MSSASESECCPSSSDREIEDFDFQAFLAAEFKTAAQTGSATSEQNRTEQPETSETCGPHEPCSGGTFIAARLAVYTFTTFATLQHSRSLAAPGGFLVQEGLPATRGASVVVQSMH